MFNQSKPKRSSTKRKRKDNNSVTKVIQYLNLNIYQNFYIKLNIKKDWILVGTTSVK